MPSLARRQEPRTLLLLLSLLALPLAGLVAPAALVAHTVVDETGRRVEVPEQIDRIVSLAPNLTEIVYALGAQDRLVGVTTACDYPPAARLKPKVGDVINPNIETIIALKPDLLLGTTAGNRRETVEAAERAGLPLYGVDPHSVADVLASIRHVADLLGMPATGAELAARLQARLDEVTRRVAGSPEPEVLFVLWLEPLLSVGHDTFLNDVLVRAGARSITAGLEHNWPRLSVEEVIERQPDFIILPRVPAVEARFDELAARPPWQKLGAVEHGRVIRVDAAILNPGPRIVDAIADLARRLHPGAFAAPPEAQP